MKTTRNPSGRDYLSARQERTRRPVSLVFGPIATAASLIALLYIWAAPAAPGPGTARTGTRVLGSGGGDPIVRPHRRSLPVLASSGTRTTTTSTTPARAHAVARPEPASTVPAPVTPAAMSISIGSGYGCGYAIQWLAGHAAPGFRFICPGNAYGRQAMTCYNIAGMCPGTKIIVIADPCPAAYMNEAHNSWIVTKQATGVLDPFGHC